jgi:pyruvate carboxylase
MYPKVFVEYASFLRRYTDVSQVPTDVLFYGLRVGEETEVEIEKGKTLFIKLVAVSEPNEQGVRTLFFELNGHPREVAVHDRRCGRHVAARPKADRDDLHHLGSPMPGTVIEVKVKPGDEVRPQDKLLVIEAMKMEMALPSPIAGIIKEIYAKPGERVDSGDLLIVFK